MCSTPELADCQRCGWCCQNLNINVCYSDILRWSKQQRLDVLRAIDYIHHDDQTKRGFYITATVTAPKKACPFYDRVEQRCRIYETRPRACAEFPQSYTAEQREKIECAGQMELPRAEAEALRKEQALDFLIAADRRDKLMRILHNAREIERLVLEILEFGADPTESLWVDGFDSTNLAWTEVGGSPYLDAVDDPANYIWTATKKAQEGYFSFDNTARPTTDILNSVTLYVYGKSDSGVDRDSYDIYDGSGWSGGYTLDSPFPNGSYAWRFVDISGHIDTWAKVDAAEMNIIHDNSADQTDIDAAYLLIDYTPVHLGVAALSGTGALIAIGTVVGGAVQGVAALSGTGALSAIGLQITYGIAALSGTGALTAVGLVTTSGIAALSGTGALTAIGDVLVQGAANLSGTGALSAVGLQLAQGVAALSGTGSLGAAGLQTALGVAALSGTGALSATGLLEAHGAAVLAGTGALTAIGQVAGAVQGIAQLTGTGTLSAIGLVQAYGVAQASGSGSLSASGLLLAQGAALLSGTGALSAIGDVTVPGVASLTGTGSLVAVGLLEAKGAAILSGTGTLTAVGTVGGIVQGVAALSGTGALSAVGLGIHLGVAAASGTGSLSASGLQLAQGNASLLGSGALTAIGNIVGPVTGIANLIGVGSLSAQCSLVAMGIAILAGSGALTASGGILTTAAPPTAVYLTRRIWDPDNKPKRRRGVPGGFAVWKVWE